MVSNRFNKFVQLVKIIFKAIGNVGTKADIQINIYDAKYTLLQSTNKFVFISVLLLKHISYYNYELK